MTSRHIPPADTAGRAGGHREGGRKRRAPRQSHAATRVRGAWRLYDLGWRVAVTALRRNRRLAEGYPQRCLQEWAGGPVDIWVQAASAGEAYLVHSLLDACRRLSPRRFLVTTNTSQGMQILKSAVSSLPGVDIQLAYFPFDRPAFMRRAVSRLQPRLAVLMETELWPGHLWALKRAGVPVLVVNGRLTRRSLNRYLTWPAFWHRLAPDRILAVSREEALRFSTLFPASRVAVMNNIKFDRHNAPPPQADGARAAFACIPADTPFVVLGSVRREEEADVARMIAFLRRRCPHAVLGLFPRHMHRVAGWSKRLARSEFPWQLHSRLQAPVPPGGVVLWDTFGTLSAAYERCQACFVGGSLAPLGGQNFLEPLARGVLPVIGPHWENFAWVGGEIVTRGLVRVAADWRQAAEMLAAVLAHPAPRQPLRQAFRAYLSARCGGTAQACREIESLLTGADDDNRPKS